MPGRQRRLPEQQEKGRPTPLFGVGLAKGEGSAGAASAALGLPGLGQHILGEDAVAPVRVVHQHMGDCPHQLAVLEDGGAAHECFSLGTTFFSSAHP